MKNQELPKTYTAKDVEDGIYRVWEKSGYFTPENLPGERKDPFVVCVPPVNVTGVLHLGHAFEDSLMDVEVRFQRMRGRKALLIPGTDHAAVATQARVEKNLIASGKYKDPREELGREKLLAIIREFAEESKSTILSQVRRMGLSCDWSRLAYTFDEDRSRAVNELFVRMYDDGLVYRGYRVINWSVKGQSTCSDDELVYVERSAKFYTFRYSKEFPISISTTRPETKLGDTAVAVHPDDKRYKTYIGKTYTVDVGSAKPLNIKIIADAAVDQGFGTGALGVTPAHSQIDYDMYEKRKGTTEEIELRAVIGPDGRMTDVAGAHYSGLTVVEAREKFVEYLRKGGLLEKEEETVQNVGTSDRFGDVIEVIPMEQWFVAVNKEIPVRGKTLKDLMREAVTRGHNGDPKQKVVITPERFHNSYLQWIDNLRDWCISRQIWWGHRIPVWYRVESRPASTPVSTRSIRGGQRGEKSKVETPPLTPPYQGVARQRAFGERPGRDKGGLGEIYVGVNPPEGDGSSSAKASADKWEQDSDTLDTWFSSGTWTFSTLGWPASTKTSSLGGPASASSFVEASEDKKATAGKPAKSSDLEQYHPTSWMQMGYEILFFWMARMILMSCYALDEIPFREVYIHGLLRDEQGRKFSKSLGNGIDPVEIIDKYGADALRLGLLIGVTPGNDSRFYENKIEHYKNFVNKLWNITRLIVSSVENLEAPEAFEPRTLADHWILGKVARLIEETTKHLDSYQFSQGAEGLYEFTWHDLADWYLEVAKLQLQVGSLEKNTESILAYLLDTILRLWHPYIPFVTEHIYQMVARNAERGTRNLLMVQEWPKVQKFSASKHVEGDFGFIQSLIGAIRNFRSEQAIEPKFTLSAKISAPRKGKLIEENREIIERLARVKLDDTLKVEKSQIKEAGFDVRLELPEKEIDQNMIAKEKTEIEKYIIQLEKKLSDKQFISKAPKAIVEAEQKRLEEARVKLAKL